MMSRFLDKTAELTPMGRRIIKVLVVLYAIAICLMCFSPQTTIDGIETPNIIYYGRLRFLLMPFNTVVGLAFIISLCIETTQIVVDLLYNANRVFEIDDLWTNTLGGLLAFLAYQWFVKQYQKYQREN